MRVNSMKILDMRASAFGQNKVFAPCRQTAPYVAFGKVFVKNQPYLLE